MHKFLFLSIIFLFAGSAASADAPLFLADRHTAKGMNCETCHAKGSAELKGDNAQHEICVSCHGFYDKVAAKTQPANPDEQNPHAQHDGNLPCSECHKGHKPGVNYCGQCHNFNFKIP